MKAKSAKAKGRKLQNLVVEELRKAYPKLEDDDRFIMDREWDEDDMKRDCPEIVKLQRGICYSGYGSGYTIQDVCDEFEKELDMMQNWQLHENYSYLSFEGIVRRTGFMMVGFGWSKHDYDGGLVVEEGKYLASKPLISPHA